MKISLLSPKEPCTSKATGWKMFPLSINLRYFSILRTLASVADVPGLHTEPRLRQLSARASTTVTSHTSCLPISQGIMVTSSGRLPSVWYSPRGSSTEGKSKDPNVCFMRELRIAWREKRLALLVQERPCKLSRSTLLPQWHVCATQMLATRRKPTIEMRSCWSSSSRFLEGTTLSHWDPGLPWWALKTFECLSSILENQILGRFDGVAVNRSNFSGRKDRGRTFDRIAGIEWNAVEFHLSLRVENVLCLPQVDWLS